MVSKLFLVFITFDSPAAYQKFSLAADEDYMKLKLESFRKAHTPVRLVKQLDKVVQSYKPVANHKHLVRDQCVLKKLKPLL